MDKDNFTIVGKSVKKIDSLALATGSEKFTLDFDMPGALSLAFLYSPHAHAEITNLDEKEALKVSGVVAVYSYKNVERVLHTTAGQGFPEPSPYDTVLFDKKVRYVGDRVAMVAAESVESAKEAVKKIKVNYKVLPHNFNAEKAMDASTPKIHTDDEFAMIPVPYEPSKNLAAEVKIDIGNVEEGFKKADFIIDETYRTQYASHCAIEPHAVITFWDRRGRLVIISTTQVPFHVRRMVSRILKYPISNIRVIKPRIGGGFGGKQEVILEPLAALVTIKTGKPVKFVMDRSEVFISARTRNPMRVRVKMGVKNSGEITALEMDALLNTGAYGAHALTVLSNGGSKVLPLFNKVPHIRFDGRSVYTNLPVGGAYRGYGATQAYFALAQNVDILTRKLDIDIVEYYKKWHIKEGETSEIFKAIGEGTEGIAQTIKSCKLSECLDRAAEEINWSRKRNKKLKVSKDVVKGVGMMAAMQGSGIPFIDMGAASMKMNEDGSFNLFLGATDIGTGSDTILAQIAAEVLSIPIEKINVLSSDTDLTPFDVGAYASSTTYVSGGAVKKCALKIKEQILNYAEKLLNSPRNLLELKKGEVVNINTAKSVSFEDIGYHSFYTHNQSQIEANASNFGEESPPPFMAHFAEVDVDTRTGQVKVVKVVTVIDCGQAINPKLVEGQVEGAVANGLSFALTEEYLFDELGKMTNPNFWDYKIFSPTDMPEMKTIIADSYDETGPFGAKSAGEIGINGPLPAIANAIYDAVGIRLNETPFTPEKILAKIKEAKNK